MARIRGCTVALRVGDTGQAVAFYSAVLGKGPDYAAHDDFHEWELCPGAWLQLSSGHETIDRSPNRTRFEVEDIAAEIARLRGLGVDVAAPTTLPKVVVFTDLADPWGNRLGLYQDIAGPEGPPPVGGSSSDEANFVPGVVLDR